MELDGSARPPALGEAALEARAGAMIARFGRNAMQRVVDEIQRALRRGDDKEAEEHHRLLRRIEEKIYGR